MNAIPHFTEAEWEVMKSIWRRAPEPSIATDIAVELAGHTGWTESTVKTLINRLLNKGALRFQKQSKLYLYYPAVTEEECRAVEADSFLNRVFDGSLSPLLNHLVDSRKLSADEIAELERLLAKTKHKGKSK